MNFAVIFAAESPLRLIFFPLSPPLQVEGERSDDQGRIYNGGRGSTVLMKSLCHRAAIPPAQMAIP